MESTHLKCNTHCDWPDCTLDGCVLKSQPKEGTQDNFWKEAIDVLLEKGSAELKYRFRIERIK